MTKNWEPVKLTRVADVVAEDWWKYHYGGKGYTAHISIGRPARDPSGTDWYCPLRIDGMHSGWTLTYARALAAGWRPVYGVGPVDAMMNAMTLVSRLFHEFGTEPQGGRRPSKSKRSGGRDR